MIETVFRSEDVAPAERFARWYERSVQGYSPVVIRSDHKEDFRATVRHLDLGAVQMSALTYPPLRVSRTRKLIAQCDTEAYQLWLNLGGTVRITQGGRSAEVGPGELVLYDTSRPYQGWTGDVEGTIVQWPRALMPLSSRILYRLTSIRISAETGMGAVLSRHLTEVVRQAAYYRSADIARLSSITLDLLAGLCAHYLEADNVLPPETRQHALLAQIHHFIDQHLGDEDLSPDTIAAAHQISARYLYKLFQQQGLTVAGWIRRRRLERCRRDLGDPHLRAQTIQQIATRWGLTDSAHFSRLFRSTYEMSPRDYRQLNDPAVRGSSNTVRPSARKPDHGLTC